MSDDHRQKVGDLLMRTRFIQVDDEDEPEFATPVPAEVSRILDALIAAGLIREADNTGDDDEQLWRDYRETTYNGKTDDDMLMNEKCAFLAGLVARSSGVADTTSKFTPEYDAGWLDGYNRAKDENQKERDALIEAAEDHRKAASLALNRVYELEAIERARESQKSVEGVADTVKEGNNE